ncbi:hypothetical protein HY640_03335 [Candidatus Woesearchaeota archaeon]|nr:hypothetical protein [Candidatus Woesearchaeota archaeon]
MKIGPTGTTIAIIVAAVLTAIAATAAYKYWTGSNQRETILEDNCGAAMGKIMHTIEDNETCAGRCKAQCVSSDTEYKRHLFEPGKNGQGCNTCRCFCS